MLTKIQLAKYDNGTYTNSVDFDAELPSGAGGFELFDVEGLGPVKSLIAHSNYAVTAGSVVHSTRGDSRSITITLSLVPDYANGRDVETLREELYNFAMTGTYVRLRLHKNGQYNRRIDGWVETHEPSIFSKDPKVVLSIFCPEPYFVAPSTIDYIGLPNTVQTLNYTGNVPWGLTIYVHLYETMSFVDVERISQDPTEESQRVRIRGELQNGRSLRIRTTPGDIDVSLRTTSDNRLIRRLIGSVSVGDSGWPMVRPGENLLHVRGSAGSSISWDNLVSARFGGF